MSWFKKPKQKITSQKRELPPDVWEKCDGCGEILYSGRLAENDHVCPTCGHHFRIDALTYAGLLLDEGFEEEFDTGLRSADPLGFVDSKSYRDRIEAASEEVGPEDAIRTGSGRVDGRQVKLGAMEFRFIGGSMGSVVGEKIRRLAERAVDERDPLIIVSASGGARMQEGIYSLMQMAKTSAALDRVADAGLPFLSILTHPTTGGVTASYAMLGDVILAEPGALIGFAGPRVIRETIRQDLPEGFQRSEFLLEHGMVDQIVPRGELKERVSVLLGHMC
ncbi:MAG: acetyl-CoA carboxylase, carboxyltransferase subunit beta [Candidatus Palauibacterales bacterium]|nr:acetyl-CoA carboxylase, carboxyltransferase subunit beta [Candidatus Palauibacterales bacterium]MDP2530494.1 acetyl-CoA carboxylase, carboxyltransferase subunit beta [Candidatus Palauibacterales bacterium]MDP2582947.1 acetyl-CoA carboxylase, carboxyltransferase subunit beta [Candidatus Palauibacterales bacterium]